MIQLPIDSSISLILEKIKKSKNLILKASPGSGKTTRLPAALLKHHFGKIIVLVPKRIAAVSAADRIAEENNWILGNEVGYHVRFEAVFNSSTKLLFMTEGVFIKKAHDSKFWDNIDVLIFDEFHERSSLSDISLGLAVERQILYDHPKIIVMSATLNSRALEAYLPQNEIFEIESPPFPLMVKYSAKPQRLICDQDFFNSVTIATTTAWSENKKDVLVFLPGLSEMRKVQSQLTKKLGSVPIEILHGSMKLSEQKHILCSQSYRRIILATDVAESSLTLPGVDAVVDCGLKKVASVEPKVGFSQLALQRISLFSAKQRAGRAARTGPGTCYRLWHESDELSMPKQIKPEILKSNLQDEILTLKSCHIADVTQFSWLDKPTEKNIHLALERLQNWKLLDPQKVLTSLGGVIQKLPLSIENSLLFFKLSESGFQKDAAHFIAALETLDLVSLFKENVLSPESDLTRLFDASLFPQGLKIKNQLAHFPLALAKSLPGKDFRKILLSIAFEYFPHRIGKKKTETEGTSSLGRGLALLSGLQARSSDYYFMLAGYNANENKTDIYFAIGLSKAEFLEYSNEKIQIKMTYSLDLEKKQLFKTQIKSVGQFIISESSKSIVLTAEQNLLWPQILEDSLETLLLSHHDYQIFMEKIKFLLKKSNALTLPISTFDFLENLSEKMFTDLKISVRSLEDFYSYPLHNLLLLHCPQEIRKLISHLPEFLNLPNGKVTKVLYTTENAPLISVKIQDIFGWIQHPMLLDQRLPITLELLAPNMRPTQITQNLKLFWEKSYFDIRKELKPRYPKHPWPDNPAEYKHEKKK